MVALCRRELFSTIGFCPPALTRQLSQPDEVGWVCTAAQAGMDLVAVHERGGIYEEEDGVLGREWEDVLEWAMEEALGYTWGEEQYDEQEDGGVYSDGC